MSAEARTASWGVRLSVISIVRNDIEGIKRTRASVANQTYPGVEHVIVDAASSDGTGEWVRSLPASVRWVSEPDDGRYAGMNKGASMATGTLLWFLHAGDIFASRDVVAKVVSDYEQFGWRWAYGAARLVDGQHQLVGINAPMPFRMSRFALGAAVIPHQAACFEATFFRELGAYDVDFGLAADQLFMLKAAKVVAPRTIADFLCDFAVDGAGCSRSPRHHYRDATRARRDADVVATAGPALDSAISLGLTSLQTLRRTVSKRLSGAG